MCHVWRWFGWKNSTEDGGGLITEIYITSAGVCDTVVIFYNGVHLKAVRCDGGKIYIDNLTLVEA